jgi:hypothetical protein
VHVRERGVVSQPPAVPTHQPLRRSDPERAVASGDKGGDETARQSMAERRRPRDRSDTVEAKHAQVGSQPQVPVRCLGYRPNDASDESGSK